MKANWKDILIGVLVAYVVVDLLMVSVMKTKHPSCLRTMMKLYSDQNGLIVIAIGVLVGGAAWYFSSLNKERFEVGKIQPENPE
uniref:Uncharacterized protein n=1 Tax=Marseillevirus LCMAC102 TaxID=2506603 RepID=A0A481YTS6_9VIRU|nr:MAG: uncharacterized protein LCMAC102_01320 [Marseillevirus LCMAC102]